MPSFNRVVIMGNLTRDPKERTFENSGNVVNMGLAINEKYQNRNGDKVVRVCFVDVVVWGRQASACKEYLHKGSPVLVEGRLQYDQWESEGQHRSCIRIRADRVQFVSPPPKSASNVS